MSLKSFIEQKADLDLEKHTNEIYEVKIIYWGKRKKACLKLDKDKIKNKNIMLE